MKSAAEPVMSAGSAVQGAEACLYLARGVRALGLLELAVLFCFIVLFALFTQTMTPVGRCGAVRRAAFGYTIRAFGLVLLSPAALEKGLVGFVALLPFSVLLLALDVSVVGHEILS
jgi:hypothetical protein